MDKEANAVIVLNIEFEEIQMRPSLPHIPPVYLPIHTLLWGYFAYALYRYGNSANGEYSTVFWPIHGVFHEVGHAVTAWCPRAVTILSGSLFQWLTPIACGIYFLFSRERHGVYVAVGWLGFSLLDSAAYMRDAIEMELPLVAPFAGGDAELIHDWNYLFSTWNILDSAHAIGNVVAVCGYSLVVVAMLAMAVAAVFGILNRKENDVMES